MYSSRAARSQALGDLVGACHAMTLEQVPGAVASYAARAGWSPVLIYVVDLQQNFLRLLPADDDRSGGRRPLELSVEDTDAGRAFQTGAVLGTASPRAEWWVPLINGAERIGVALIGATGAEPDDAAPTADLDALAGLIALLVASKRDMSDSYARLVRRQDMKVASEMEWHLMPPRTFATDRAFISAVLEPAYEVSGDAFDYAVTDDVVHVAVFDAMGHDTAAGLTANLAVAAGRKYRRQGAELAQVADGIEKALVEQFGGTRYATGILASLHLATGRLDWASLGHFPPVVLRPDDPAEQLACAPAPPMGTDLGLPVTVCNRQLRPGDRLVLYTDGITEARNRAGEEFGLARLTGFLQQHCHDELPVPELLRRLIRHHHAYHEGKLDDDATVVLMEWHGPAPYQPARLSRLIGVRPPVPPSTDR